MTSVLSRLGDAWARLSAASLLLSALAAGAQAQTPAWQVETGAAVERLSNAAPDWRQADFFLRRRFVAGAQAELTLREARRYARRDSELGLGLSLPLNEHWTFGLRGSVSGTADFLPRESGQIELSRRVAEGWVLGAALGRSRYETGIGPNSGSSLLRLGVERYVGDWRWAAAATRARLDGGESADGWRGQLDRYFGDRGRLGLLLAGGRELESAPEGLISTRVETIAVLARWPVSMSWAVTGEIARTRVSDLLRGSGDSAVALPGGYSRSGLRLGVQYEF